jgi:uroporphyrinogen-III synthase
MPLNPKSEIQNPQPPLAGKTILVTRSAGQSSQFSDLLKQEGATVMEMPALEIGPPSSWEDLDNAIAHLEDFDWLILTSTNGVDYFWQRLEAQGKDVCALADVKIAVVGKKTAASLKQRSLQPDFIPPDFVADSLVQHFPEQLEGKKVLFPRVETGGREVLVKELTAKGAQVIEVAAYQSRCPEAIAPSTLHVLQEKAVDAIAFASSKTVKNFCQLLDASGGASLEGVCIASIGPQTSVTCQKVLGRVDVEAEEYTLEGLTQAIVQWAKSASHPV